MPLPYSNFRDGASSEPVKTIKISDNEDSSVDYLEICAQDLIDAVKANDTKGVAEALRAALDLLDSEDPHTNEE